MFLTTLRSLKVKIPVFLIVSFLGFGPMFLSTPAHAVEETGQEAQPFDKVVIQGLKVFQSARQVVFVIGGFGLIGLAGMAIFGDLDWKWFFALAFGLILVAVAGTIVNFMVGDANIKGFTDSDTLLK